MMSQPTALRPEHFAEFFRAVNGFDPFPWQERLAERVTKGDWPRALDLPTASGKTACIDIAVFALACQAGRPAAERTAPRRIIFVVDRRVIVDEAYDRAGKIALRLHSGTDNSGVPRPILDHVAAALRLAGGLEPGEPPLLRALLRGGIYRDQAWAKSPVQPTVIASTVDQIGSRLLFRGYGLSDSLKPIHAGLAANDALILLDEAHCAQPFLQTAEAIRDYRRFGAERAPALPFHFTILSATPPPSIAAGDIFHLDPEEDLKSEHLGPRLLASKPVELVLEVVPGGAKGQKKWAEKLLERARRLVNAHDLRAVAILVNRVDIALDVEVLAKKEWPGGKENVVCLTGRVRPFDRDQILGEWKEKLEAKRDRPRLEKPALVVATQCLEVGANLDFEGMVTECASLDALRQRFGRLNRLGQCPAARGVILMRSDQVRDEDELQKEPPTKKDPIYGDALPRTWNWLRERAKAGEQGNGREVDFGVEALRKVLPDMSAGLSRLNAPSGEAPYLLPTHLDYLVQTAPRPEPDPDVALFLHGPDSARPEIMVCLRFDLSLDCELEGDEEGADDKKRYRDRWIEAVALCPPTAAECLRVPLYVARRWLAGDDQRALGEPGGDLEHQPASTRSEPEETEVERVALRWCGPDNKETKIVQSLRELWPGDTLVVPTSEKGLTALGQLPEVRSAWEYDIAERVYPTVHRRYVLRLHPSRFEDLPDDDATKTLRRISSEDEEPRQARDELSKALGRLAELPGAPDWFKGPAGKLASDRNLKVLLHPDHRLRSAGREGKAILFPASFPGGLVLVGSVLHREKLADERDSVDEFTTEEDLGSVTERAPVALSLHTEGVVEKTKAFARCCGVSESMCEALASAARWHDLGKADPRFQAWLFEGNAQVARSARELRAKGLPLSRVERERARQSSGYPRGARHELVSVRLVEGLLKNLDPTIDQDLVSHLIASHHGHARPFAPFVEDETPVEVRCTENGKTLAASSDTRLHQLDSGPPERFWKLVRQYGWWGLAWLEALLRLADHRQSETEQATSSGNGREDES
jgi:CRISPR-associated endonuclease/helicase Cas3